MAPVIIISAAVLVSAVILAAFFSTARTRKKLEYMLDALEDGETNFRFSEHRVFDRKLNRSLNRIKSIFDREKAVVMEQERYYGLMLDNVRTGIIVADASDGRVSYTNARALELLGVSGIVNLRQLRRMDSGLYEAFLRVEEGHDEKASYSTESSIRTISISASSAELFGRRVRILVFNDISSDMEENETESWTRLVRVLTHEIMNTVSPISSLSESLVHASGADLKAGLETIASSSRGLMKFVESYRSLTHLAAPVKKAFYLKELVDRVRELTESQLQAAGAVFSYNELSEDILLYADEDQIAQIMVNLFRNALQAGAHRLDVTAFIDSMESVVVEVSNDGVPISRESQEEIFVPFFTTKPSGTGIGLSISRQIMRLHGGSLRLARSDSSSTVFTLVFR